MIRHTDSGAPRRRLAIIQTARPQSARLGSVGPAPPAPVAWTTISTSVPDTSASWLSYKLMEQSHARETTPGTLVYSPADDTPAPVVAPWNSWSVAGCTTYTAQQLAQLGIQQPPAATTPAADYTKAFLAMAGIGTVAALAYLLSGGRK
jgi:hypothetical protein